MDTSTLAVSAVKIDKQVARLAGLRVAIDLIEARALESYWLGGEESYEEVLRFLDDCSDNLDSMVKRMRKTTNRKDCPDGTSNHAGVCLPD